MELKQEGGEWKGVMRAPEGGSIGLPQLAVAPDQVGFQVDTQNGSVKVQMSSRTACSRAPGRRRTRPPGRSKHAANLGSRVEERRIEERHLGPAAEAHTEYVAHTARGVDVPRAEGVQP